MMCAVSSLHTRTSNTGLPWGFDLLQIPSPQGTANLDRSWQGRMPQSTPDWLLDKPLAMFESSLLRKPHCWSMLGRVHLPTSCIC